MSKNAVTRAFDLTRERYDSLAVVCGLLNVTSSYAYQAMNEGELSLPCSLKMEILTEGEITWQELCPKVASDIERFKARVENY